MTEITHQKARSLLHRAADQMLSEEEKSTLDAHLANCQDCLDYASDLSALEVNLREAFHSSWDSRQGPRLDLLAILKPSPAKLLWNNIFGHANTIGKATIIALLVAGYFIIANLLGIPAPIASEKTATALPTPNEFAPVHAISPTPSAKLSPASTISQTCETATYLVQENNTLASIALHYKVAPESILEYNHLTSETVVPGMKLLIPLCNNSPSETATLVGNSITITPVDGTLISTQPQ